MLTKYVKANAKYKVLKVLDKANSSLKKRYFWVKWKFQDLSLI